VWMPTFSAANHIRHSHRKNYLATKDAMLKPKALTVVNASGELLDEAKIILDQIAQYDAVLSAGHLHISEIWPLFDEAKARGVKRLLVNHPTFLIDASISDITELARMGAMLEHSSCMWAGVQNKSGKYTADGLNSLIKAGGVEHTIIGSDLGQEGNPTPVEGLKYVIGMVLDLGYSESDIRKMIGGNAARLMGMDP
jgi:hypothetical protein